MKCPLNKFCTMANSKHSRTVKQAAAALRVSELRQVLCKLGQCLPWLKEGDVRPNSVVSLVDDIIKHRRTLMLEFMSACESEEQDQEDQEEGRATEHNMPSIGGKRQIFLPPSALNCKRIRLDTPGPEVTGDEEISDTEVESYIRSPEEVRLYEEAQRRLE